MPGVLTWLGHATVLIELGGARLITDPLLRPRVAHLLREVPEPDDLGRLDAILISHGHHDHLDPPSLRRLDPDAAIVAPRPPRARCAAAAARSIRWAPARRSSSPGCRCRRSGRPRRPPDPGGPPVERRRLRRRRRLLRRRHGAVSGDGGPGGHARRGAHPDHRLGPEDRARAHGPARGRGGARAAAARARGADPLGHLPAHRPPAERRPGARVRGARGRARAATCGWPCSSPAARSRSPGRCDPRSPRAPSVGA